MEQDLRFMREALALARRGEGATRPNPPVGAVVVRGGRVVGRGYHPRAGAPHAEVFALRAAGARARGATLYVTLEPCCTWGRTGPCTEAIKAAGIRRVVAGTVDPNPAHAGRGLRRLRAAGITVKSGVLGEACAALIAPFATWVTCGRPYVTLKLAMTLDGRIADASGKSRWISSPSARVRVQDLRHRADAILVGATTARRDDPSLTSRRPRAAALLRVVVDSRGKLSPKARVLTDGAAAQTIMATTARCPAARRAAYARKGARVWVLPARGGHVSLGVLMRRLAGEGMIHVVCEGGGELGAALVHARLVDRLWLFVAPTMLGARGVPAIGGAGWPLGKAPAWRLIACRRVGVDVMIEAVPAV